MEQRLEETEEGFEDREYRVHDAREDVLERTDKVLDGVCDGRHRERQLAEEIVSGRVAAGVGDVRVN